jgi:hypothetical protein
MIGLGASVIWRRRSHMTCYQRRVVHRGGDVLALSNGIGSGILMTLGADLARRPTPHRSWERGGSRATSAGRRYRWRSRGDGAGIVSAATGVVGVLG